MTRLLIIVCAAMDETTQNSCTCASSALRRDVPEDNPPSLGKNPSPPSSAEVLSLAFKDRTLSIQSQEELKSSA